MRRFLIMWLAALMMAPCAAEGAAVGGIKLFYKDTSGLNVGFYTGSYALLIGVSRYSAEWPPLERVPEDLARVETALEQQGFQVEKVLNPNGTQLKKAFELFIRLYGQEPNNRLVFYFAGHSFNPKGEPDGYLVPSDAPGPNFREEGLKQVCLSIDQVLAWSTQIETRHVLFLFESCLEGARFKVQAFPRRPPEISAHTANYARHFFASCSAGESLSRESVLAPFLIKALGGKADFNKDGYVTGSELGAYLYERILNYGGGATPQYGKFKRPDQEEGEFVFVVPLTAQSKESRLASQTSDPEADMWNLVKDSTDGEDIRGFLATFPDGRFAQHARSRLEALESKGLSERAKAQYDRGDYGQALRGFEGAAERGDADAQYYLGLMYSAGQGVLRDPRTAASWFQKAARQGHREAQYHMGILLFEGEGVDRDESKALGWFRQSAAQGHPGARAYAARIQDSRDGALYFKEGMKHYKAEEYDAARTWFSKAKDKGHPDAQDYVERIRLAQQAAEKAEKEGAALFERGLEHYNSNNYPEALKWFEQAAGRGHPDAENYISLIRDAVEARERERKEGDIALETGKRYLKSENYPEALKWFNKAKEKAQPEAEAYLARTRERQEAGAMFEKGMAYRDAKDYAEALKWLERAADGGHGGAKRVLPLVQEEMEAETFFDRGLATYDQRNYEEALAWFRKAADKGHPLAPEYVARVRGALKPEEKPVVDGEPFYRKGLAQYEAGNYTEAIQWFEKAATGGLPDAQNYLGLMYDRGEGVAKDEGEAVGWFKKAADQGHLHAQYNLAIQYYEGRQVGRDYGEALKWFQRAAAAGHAGAQNYVGLMYDSGKGVVRDEREAVRWFRKAADQGHIYAQYNLAIQYYEGRQVGRDYGEALKWFQRAAAAGHAGAQNFIGLMYDSGRGVERDEHVAVKWFVKAADQEHIYAQYNLAIQYYEGRQVTRDYEAALAWFRKAADRKHPKAQNYLGIMYENGYGCRPDPEEAKKWYRRAQQNGHPEAGKALRRLGG
jgi:TPR repeat protein